jgi:hypothetical protein
LGREKGPRNWELEVLPVGAVSAKAAGSLSEGNKGISLKDKTDLSPTQLQRYTPTDQNGRPMLEEKLERRLLERSSLQQGSGLLLEYIPLYPLLISRQPINPVNGHLPREPPWYG